MMKPRNTFDNNDGQKNTLAIFLLILLLVACHSLRFTAHAQNLPESEAPPDVMLIDQTGARVRFCRETSEDRVLIINFIYTTCEAVCSLQGSAFSRLQAELGDRLGREVVLVSISADPEVDTPARLKEWGTRFGAKPGWVMLTGERAEIDKLFRFFTGDIARRQMHSPVVFIGSCKRNRWAREYSLAEPARFLKFVEESLAQ